MSADAGGSSPDTGLTLLVSPPPDRTVRRACLSRVGGADPSDRDLLAVTYAESGEEFVESWREHVGEQPHSLAVIDVGDGMRSAATEPPPSAASDPGLRNVARSIPACDGLEDVVGAVEGAVEAQSGTGAEPVLYLDSLTELLSVTELSAALDGLVSVRDLLDRARAGYRGYVRVDGSAHDPRTLTICRPLFDSVLELSTDGDGWSWSDGSDGLGTRPDDEASLLDLSEVMDLLRSRRRRLVLSHLRRVGGTATVSDLAGVVADAETDGTVTDDDRSRTHVALHRIELPKLTEHGVVAFDESSGSVESRPPARQLEPFLGLTIGEDHAGRPHGPGR